MPSKKNIGQFVEEGTAESKNEPRRGAVEERTDGELSSSRRTLLHASWAIPVVLAVGLPEKIYAGTPCRVEGDCTPTDAPASPSDNGLV